MEKTHWKKLKNPNYLGAHDLMTDNNKSIELEAEITKVVREQVTNTEGQKEECTVAYLKGKKPIILNTTNCKAISKATGTVFIEDWAGQRITIYVAKVKAFGDVVDALRIKAQKPPLPVLTLDNEHFDAMRKAIQTGDRTLDDLKKKFQILPNIEKELLKNEGV